MIFLREVVPYRDIQDEGGSAERLIALIDYKYDGKGQRIGRRTINDSGRCDTGMRASYDAVNRPDGRNARDDNEKTEYRWDSSYLWKRAVRL